MPEKQKKPRGFMRAVGEADSSGMLRWLAMDVKTLFKNKSRDAQPLEQVPAQLERLPADSAQLNRALLEAVRELDPARVLRLLGKGVDVNVRDENGVPAILYNFHTRFRTPELRRQHTDNDENDRAAQVFFNLANSSADLSVEIDGVNCFGAMMMHLRMLKDTHDHDKLEGWYYQRLGGITKRYGQEKIGFFAGATYEKSAAGIALDSDETKISRLACHKYVMNIIDSNMDDLPEGHYAERLSTDLMEVHKTYYRTGVLMKCTLESRSGIVARLVESFIRNEHRENFCGQMAEADFNFEVPADRGREWLMWAIRQESAAAIVRMFVKNGAVLEEEHLLHAHIHQRELVPFLEHLHKKQDLTLKPEIVVLRQPLGSAVLYEAFNFKAGVCHVFAETDRGPGPVTVVPFHEMENREGLREAFGIYKERGGKRDESCLYATPVEGGKKAPEVF